MGFFYLLASASKNMGLFGWGAALIALEILVGRALRFTEKLLKFFNIFMSLHRRREEDAMCVHSPVADF